MSAIDKEKDISPSKSSLDDFIVSKDDAKEAKYRIYSTISYFIVLILIGIPIWWYTTRVYRASLPLSEIYKLELQNRTSKEYGVPLSLEYDVLISFVHPDPQNLKIDITGQELDRHLQEFLNKISSIANFVVKSQWLYLTELGASPRKILDHYALLENQLPHIITPLESKLWTHLSPRPTLNLVIYFPHCSSPLYIYSNDNKMSPTNAFVSERWGGIYIMNPDQNSCEMHFFKPKLNPIVSTFVGILQDLLKLEDTSETSIVSLKLQRTEQMLESSKRTLKSLAQLLSEINSIVISDEVANKIDISVQKVRQTEEYLNKGYLDKALETAKDAFKYSEEAFGDPSLLALLYFPDDQKYAIYIPLYLPVMIPVAASLFTLRSKLMDKKPKTD